MIFDFFTHHLKEQFFNQCEALEKFLVEQFSKEELEWIYANIGFHYILKQNAIECMLFFKYSFIVFDNFVIRSRNGLIDEIISQIKKEIKLIEKDVLRKQKVKEVQEKYEKIKNSLRKINEINNSKTSV